GQIADGDLSVGNPHLDQPLDVARMHRHGKPSADCPGHRSGSRQSWRSTILPVNQWLGWKIMPPATTKSKRGSHPSSGDEDIVAAVIVASEPVSAPITPCIQPCAPAI